MLEEVSGKVFGSHVQLSFGLIAEVHGQVHGSAHLGVGDEVCAEAVEQRVDVLG